MRSRFLRTCVHSSAFIRQKRQVVLKKKVLSFVGSAGTKNRYFHTTNYFTSLVSKIRWYKFIVAHIHTHKHTHTHVSNACLQYRRHVYKNCTMKSNPNCRQDTPHLLKREGRGGRGWLQRQVGMIWTMTEMLV